MGRPTVPEAEYVRSMVQRLWPGDLVELHTRPPSLRRPSGTFDLVVLPSLGRPRLLIPREGAAASAALRGYRTSATRRARLKLEVVSRLASLGATRFLPHVVRVSPPTGERAEGLDACLSRALGLPVVVSIHVGPQRAVRKPVVQVLTPAGVTLAFAKIGTNPLTNRLVTREAERLARIDRTKLRFVEAPELLHHGSWNGLEVLVQRALTADPTERITPLLRVESMLEVNALDEIEKAVVGEHPYLDRLRARLDALPPSDLACALGTALDAVSKLAADVRLQFGAWHGDWSPWNMAARDGRLLLWDWEHFEVGVPSGYDALHCHVHTAVKDGAGAIAAYASALGQLGSLLGPFQDSSRAQRVTSLLYTIDIAVRYLHDREDEGDTDLGNVSGWLAPTLRSQVGELREVATR